MNVVKTPRRLCFFVKSFSTSELYCFWKVFCSSVKKRSLLSLLKSVWIPWFSQHVLYFPTGQHWFINLCCRTWSLFAINNKGHPLKNIIFGWNQQRASWAPVEKMHHPPKNIVSFCNQQRASLTPVGYIVLESSPNVSHSSWIQLQHL